MSLRAEQEIGEDCQSKQGHGGKHASRDGQRTLRCAQRRLKVINGVGLDSDGLSVGVNLLVKCGEYRIGSRLFLNRHSCAKLAESLEQLRGFIHDDRQELSGNLQRCDPRNAHADLPEL